MTIDSITYPALPYGLFINHQGVAYTRWQGQYNKFMSFITNGVAVYGDPPKKNTKITYKFLSDMKRRKLLSGFRAAGIASLIFIISNYIYITYKYVTYQPTYVVDEVIKKENGYYKVKMTNTKTGVVINDKIRTNGEKVSKGYEYKRDEAKWYVYLILTITTILITHLLINHTILPINKELYGN